MLVVFGGECGLWGQTAKAKKPQADAVVQETENYREAMSWFRKGEDMIGSDRENSEEQAEMFRKAISIRPVFVDAHYNLGLIYLNQGKMKDAAAEFETVLSLEPKYDVNIYYLLAAAYRESGDFEKSIATLEKGLEKKPEDPVMLKALGYLQFNTDRDDAAVATLERIITLDPTDVDARLDLALLHQKKDRTEQAVAGYKKALELAPKNFAAHYNLGLLYVKQRKPEAAADEFDAARALEPGNVELLERLGDTRAYLKQYILAADAYQDALDRAGDPKLLMPKLGFSLANDGKVSAAIAALEKAVSLDAKNSDAWFLLGDLCADSGKAEAAIAAYKKTAELRPDLKEVRLNLGVLHANREMYPDAMAEFQQAVALDDGYAAAWSNIALIAEKLDDDKGAISAHEKLSSLGKAKALNYFHLGVLYARNSEADLSINAFAKAIELEPERYRTVLKDELKNVHSVLDNIRFQKRFMDLLTIP